MTLFADPIGSPSHMWLYCLSGIVFCHLNAVVKEVREVYIVIPVYFLANASIRYVFNPPPDKLDSKCQTQ